MLHSINPGHAFPFFSNSFKQAFRQVTAVGEPITGLIADDNQLIPFQIRFQSGPNPPSWAIVNIITGQRISLPANLLTKTNTGNIDICTYNGGDIGQTLTCGDYYYVELTCNGSDVFSEVFRIELTGGAIIGNNFSIVLLEWFNSTDLDGIRYQDGYHQKIYLKSYFDRGFIERAESVISDGYGNEVVTESKTTEKIKFESFPIHEQQLLAYQLIRDCDNIQVRDIVRSEIVNASDFQFSYEPIGNSYYKGIFTFQVHNLINQKC